MAGPGSGKTAVLTLRIANLITNSPDESFRILGLTFTVKAANEMQNRIRELTGEESRRIKLCTFHSFCTDLLRQHGSQLGLRPDFSVITDDKDRLAILGEFGAARIQTRRQGGSKQAGAHWVLTFVWGLGAGLERLTVW